MYDGEGKGNRDAQTSNPLGVPPGASERVPLPAFARAGGREHDAQFLLDSCSGELPVLSPPKSLSTDGVSAMQRLGLLPGGSSSGGQVFHDADSGIQPRLQPEEMLASQGGDDVLAAWQSAGTPPLLCLLQVLSNHVQACVDVLH